MCFLQISYFDMLLLLQKLGRVFWYLGLRTGRETFVSEGFVLRRIPDQACFVDEAYRKRAGWCERDGD